MPPRSKLKGKSAPSTRAMREWQATRCIEFVFREWAAKITSAMGKRDGRQGLAAVDPLDWVNAAGEIQIHSKLGNPKIEEFGMNKGIEDVDNLPTWSGADGAETTEVSRGMLASGLITVADAEKALEESSLIVLKRFENALRLQPAAPRYRKWAAIRLSQRIMRKQIEVGKVSLLALALKQDNSDTARGGWQRISTTRRSALPKGQLVTFSGRPAWRGAPGRPALPESVWRSRYLSRLQQRRRKNQTKITRRRGVVSIPATKYQRPPFVMPVVR